MQRFAIIAGALFAALAVITGAFGAHALHGLLSESQAVTYSTAVRYQFYHAFALLITGILIDKFNSSILRIAVIAFVAGIFLFCGTLYLSACKTLLGMETFDGFALLAPAGGMAFVTGWVSLAIGVFTGKRP